MNRLIITQIEKYIPFIFGKKGIDLISCLDIDFVK